MCNLWKTGPTVVFLTSGYFFHKDLLLLKLTFIDSLYVLDTMLNTSCELLVHLIM